MDPQKEQSNEQEASVLPNVKQETEVLPNSTVDKSNEEQQPDERPKSPPLANSSPIPPALDETAIASLESSLVASQEKEGPHSVPTQRIIVDLVKSLNKAALNLLPSPSSPRKNKPRISNPTDGNTTVVSDPDPKELARHHLQKSLYLCQPSILLQPDLRQSMHLTLNNFAIVEGAEPGGDPEKALPYLIRLLKGEKGGGAPETHINISTCLYKLGHLSRALTHVNAALKILNLNPGLKKDKKWSEKGNVELEKMAFYNLGCILEKKGRKREAEECFEKCKGGMSVTVRPSGGKKRIGKKSPRTGRNIVLKKVDGARDEEKKDDAIWQAETLPFTETTKTLTT
ncbi:hypothetical protein TrVE_jg12805 [Triparma verrucosa]|uniref:Uncharacterized protein n=1 Tax=Triparma verrucosa TaxID=1606542 RepID=A0A9W7F723_9STRA|nr:hypothetical protein TrVE_jg12805 [Triparma verrucosa]